ncbi:MAG: type II toxin-antitoxin system RelE/ParE family toxin [archaeon]|nr:type II toxin-antitoxin system RelE/ParE family toxin [archaeon]
MPDFNVFLSNNAEKGLKKSEPNIRQQLQNAIDALENNPVPTKDFDVTKISSSISNYRIRIGRYWILYTINWEDKEVKVFGIDKRKGSSYD